MTSPYGECHHTKYEGCPPCIHDAYERGKQDMRVYLLADDENSYAQGYREGVERKRDACNDARILGYREGYNDHARSQQHWQDTHGAYRGEPRVVKKSEAHILNSPVADSAARLTPKIMRDVFNQHGEGENP